MSEDRCASSEAHLQELADLISGRLTTGDLRDIKCDATLELRAVELYAATTKGDEVRLVLDKLSRKRSCHISAIRDALHLLRGESPTRSASSAEVVPVSAARELAYQG